MASAADFSELQRKQLPINLRPEDCRGRTFIITGSNSGIGYECVRHLVRLEATRVIMAVRDLVGGESSIDTIEVAADRHGILQVWHLDLASFESVKKFVNKVEKELDRVDVLVCNAGMITNKWEVTEGMESTLTVNLMSNMLLTTSMLPVMASKASGTDSNPRIVHVGSTNGYHNRGALIQSIKKDDILQDLNDQTKWGSQMQSRYILSKILRHFAVRQLADRGAVSDTGVIINIVDPGLCKTRLSRNSGLSTRIKTFFSHIMMGRTPEAGSRALLAGIAAGEESHGKMLLNCELADDKMPSWMTNEEGQKFQQQLWMEIAEKMETISPGCLDCPEE